MRLAVSLPVIALFFLACSCGPSAQVHQSTRSQLKLSPAGQDSLEYNIIIIDPGFESWFVANRKPEWFYTKEFLSSWNRQYVVAWNMKVRDPDFQLRNPNNPFTEEIQYLPETDYGMEVNYKLYHYFLFIESTWGAIIPNIRRK